MDQAILKCVLVWREEYFILKDSVTGAFLTWKNDIL